MRVCFGRLRSLSSPSEKPNSKQNVAKQKPCRHIYGKFLVLGGAIIQKKMGKKGEKRKETKETSKRRKESRRKKKRKVAARLPLFFHARGLGFVTGFEEPDSALLPPSGSVWSSSSLVGMRARVYFLFKQLHPNKGPPTRPLKVTPPCTPPPTPTLAPCSPLHQPSPGASRRG